ncbi:ATP-dependent zinc metalloprotease FtsH [Flavihumibacter rivuli]|uniref:ATP-dependent zinc metalloprotease FtsH n=1 Tax=Flavihumibacter rivuli TaxID=2838156 RepID=UPI001BDE4465|nr:ATP-dependent zinc metalloprotease FtsH [Flavihumibacter rivuli]ULQ57752.1 ATP-dependent zinc metalloprotease FtsH [Flavihumibacter rivuli]
MSNTPPTSPNGKDRSKKGLPGPARWYWFYILLLALILLPYLFGKGLGAKQLNWQEFEQSILPKHAVERIVVVNGQTAQVYIKPSFVNDPYFREVLKPRFGSGIRPGPHYELAIGTIDLFERKMADAQRNTADKEKIPITYETTRNWGIAIFEWILPLVIMLVLWRFLLGRMGTGDIGGGSSIFNFGKSTATLHEKEDKSTVTFDDVAGLEEAKTEVKEVVDFLKDPARYTRLGAKIPKGVIIVGPPGTGKTLLVKAVAGEAQVPFFSISGSEFVEMFVGVGASRVRDLFRRAKEKAPCIVFIDEIDAVGRSRGRNAFYTGANDERESTLNQLLTEMDGFSTNSGVIVLAATNRADMLDPALLRPGRFDRHIYLELPSQLERKAIFKVHMRPLVMAGDVDVDFLAAQTPGFSGADIANICNEAALIAARRKKDKIERVDFMDAIDRIIAGLERKSKILSPTEKTIIAYHEAGHAVTSWYLPHVDPLSKVSIIPRGKALGAAWYLPEERQLRTELELTEKLSATLGGRAAEQLVFGEVTSGALDDLEKVTKEAYKMVAYLGFNEKIGQVSFYDSTGTYESSLQKAYSEATGRLIDEEVRKLVDKAYQAALELLTEHRPQLEALAQFLLKKEVVYQEDLVGLLGKRPVAEAQVIEGPQSH